MITQLLLLMLGIFILWRASDITVDASKRLAKKYSISPLIVGLTIVSIGTSFPEIFTNVYAGFQIKAGVDVSDLAIGTTIGSQVSQITLILGITALVGALCVTKKSLKRDGTMLIVAILGMTLAGLDGRITPIEGLVLSTGYIIYIAYLYKTNMVFQNIKKEVKEKRLKEIRASTQFFAIAVSIALLIIGGKLVVDNAYKMAVDYGLSEGLIGIFIIGLGTSLPELSIGISGMRKKARGISIGTLLGSNITDPMLSLGLGAMVAGFSFDMRLWAFDIPFWLIATCLVLLLLWHCKTERKHRRLGLTLIIIYGVFAVLKLLVFS